MISILFKLLPFNSLLYYSTSFRIILHPIFHYPNFSNFDFFKSLNSYSIMACLTNRERVPVDQPVLVFNAILP